MTDEARWGDLRPILQDMAERIARIEQYLAESGVPGQGFSPAFGSSGQAAAQAYGIYPTDGASYPTDGPQDGGVPANIVLLAQSGKTIQAIQQYRQLTGVGLKEAKAIVEQAAIRGY